MPGYVIHLATAEEIIKKLDIRDEEFINQFLIGSIIPDSLKRDEKKESHFWSEEMFKRFVRKPDVTSFVDKYGQNMDNPYVLGYYAHLLLDAEFIDQYWFKHFLFYNADMRKATLYNEVAHVYLVDADTVYNREDFFSNKMYYGDYDRMNSYIITKYNVRVPKLSKVPSLIEEVDYQTAKPALQEMLELLNNATEETDTLGLKVFNLEDIELLIHNTADKVVRTIAKY